MINTKRSTPEIPHNHSTSKQKCPSHLPCHIRLSTFKNMLRQWRWFQLVLVKWQVLYGNWLTRYTRELHYWMSRPWRLCTVHIQITKHYTV